VAVGFGALAGLCTTFAVALSLLLADGLSWGLALTWVLFLAAGPALATLLFSRPEGNGGFTSHTYGNGRPNRKGKIW
jgi:hypothetical protein